MKRYGSGGPWEDTVGYSRVVVAGPWVLTAGCTSTVDGVVALEAIVRAGADVADVVRTRAYHVDPADAEAAGRAHKELFGDVRPASTMLVVARLIHPRLPGRGRGGCGPCTLRP